MPEMVCNAAAVAYAARGSSKGRLISAHGSEYANRPLLGTSTNMRSSWPVDSARSWMRIGLLYGHDLARARY